MNVAVVGGKGMLGSDLLGVLAAQGYQATSLDLPGFDALNDEHLKRLETGAFGPFDRLVNCAAYTAVDKAESEPELTHQLNAILPQNLATLCHRNGAGFIHISTDFVFDGKNERPYVESDPTNPLSMYGKTKLAGESNVLAANPNALICRTSWLFGAYGKSFPRTILKAWMAGTNLRVVSDQVGCATYTMNLAHILAKLMDLRPPGGVYHTVGSEDCSWYQLACTAIETAHEAGWEGPWPPSIESVDSSAWPTPAQRPRNSRLSCEKLYSLGIPPMPDMRSSLRDFLNRLDPLTL